MANTYHQIYLQTIFAVKYRKATLLKDWRKDVFATIGQLINDTGCKTLIINGMEDHVHCFFALKPSISLSDLMRIVKAKSSKKINESGYLQHRFEWQKGYGSFSYSHSHMNSVYHYIKNQEKHHKHMTFREEYVKLLDKFGVTYDERFIFHELI